MSYTWGDQKRYNDYSSYIRTLFPARVQKLSIDAGFTCPNRDGTKGRAGCTYCNNESFKPDYCQPTKSVTQQIKEGKDFFSKRRNVGSYLAYFQAFSNTYAPIVTLEKLYSEALNTPGIVGIVIATRPDCIDDEKISLLQQLARKYYVSVEYGIESCDNGTLKEINRQHTFEETIQAIQLTSNKGIHIGAHLILGLPGEDKDIILSHADKISNLPIQTLKLHQLQIVKQTVMAKQFVKHPEMFEFFTVEDYIDLVISFLERLNPEIVIERYVSQSPKDILIHPSWGLKNFEIVHKIKKRLEVLNTYQGRLYRQIVD